MSQSTFIIGALIAFFILWLAAQGKLNRYWQLLTGGGKSSAPDTASGTNPGTGFSPTVPFSSDWWNNFLRPWRGG